MIGARPLQELHLCHCLRLQPDTFLHLLGREPLPPSARLILRKIHERAFLLFQILDLLEYLSPCRRHESCGQRIAQETNHVSRRTREDCCRPESPVGKTEEGGQVAAFPLLYMAFLYLPHLGNRRKK